MRHIRFGRTDVQVPTVSLGTWGHGGPHLSEGVSVGWSGHDDRAAKDAIFAAHRAGITHWDTADAYGNGHAETLIGELWDQVPRRGIDQVRECVDLRRLPAPGDHHPPRQGTAPGRAPPAR